MRWAINIGLKGIWTAGGAETGMKKRRKKKESSLGFLFEIQAVWENGVSVKKPSKMPPSSLTRKALFGTSVCA